MTTILLVEDNRPLAAHWQQSLEAEGYRVIHETSVEAAIDVMEDTTLDLVITDIVLESDNEQLALSGGLAVISYIALNLDPQPKIIATSGDSQSPFVDGNFSRLNSMRRLRKPVAVETLLETIRALLEVEVSAGDTKAETRSALQSRLMLQVFGETSGVWDWQVGTDNAEYSTGWRKMLGFDAKDLEGFPNTLQAFDERVHPDDKQALWDAVENAFQQQSLFDHEFRVRNRDDEYIWVQSRGTATYGADGKPIRLVGATHNVTSRKQAEFERNAALESLKQRTADLRRTQYAVDNVADPVFMVGQDGGIVYANKQAVEKLGFTAEELCQMHIAEINTTYTREEWSTRWQQTKEAGVLQFDSIHRCKDGSYYECVVTKHHLDFDGEEILYETVQDVTEQRRLARSRAAVAAQLAQIIEAMPLAVVYVDESRNILRVNPAFERLFGYTSAESLGRQTVFFYADPDDFHAMGRKRFSEDAPRTTAPREVRYRRKDGTTFIGETIGTPVTDEASNVIGFLGLVADITERKQSEDRIRAAQLQADSLSSILEESRNEVYAFDADSLAFVYVNRGALQNIGYSLEEMKARTPLDIKPAHDTESFASLVQPLLEHVRQKIVFETIHERKDGSRYEVEVHLQLADYLGRPSFVAIIVDITERKQAQRLLLKATRSFKESEERMNWAMTNANIGLWDWEPESDRVIFNDVAKTQLGYSADEDWNSFAEWESRLHPEDREMALAAAQKLADSPKALYNSIFRLRTQQGSYCWINSIGKGVFDSDGRLLRLTGVHINIHEREEARLRAEESEQRFRALADSASPLAWTTELDSGCSWLNRRWLEYTGTTLESQLGDGWIESVHPQDREETFARYSEAFARREPFEFEYRLRRHDGEYRWFMVNATPRLNPGREFVGYVGMSFDNHDARKARVKLEASEAHLKEVNLRLEKTNADLEHFAYVASHDLKQPLRGIDKLAQFVIEDVGESLPQESRTHLQMMRDRVERLNELLTDLLRYSRAGTEDGDVVEVDSGELIDAVVDLLSGPPEFQVRRDSEMPVLRTVKAPIEQVFFNLIGNAIKHRESDSGMVTISGSEENGWVTFRVEDTGIGIDPAFHSRIFEMFTTLRPRDEVEGSGMGLAMVHKLVHSVGGRVWIDSEPGRGAAFSFTWPLAAD
ncbi:MAG: PAS domain S-box protein [Planctomycetota bacterium]